MRIRKHRSRQGLRLAITCFVLLSPVALSKEHEKPKPTATPKPTLAPGSRGTPKPVATPDTKIDAKTEAELLQAEDRFVNAIRNHDTKEFEELLADYYADSLAGDERALSKQGALARLAAGKLPAYRVIAAGRKLTRNVDLFVVEGRARDLEAEVSDENPKEGWVQVRRRWTKRGDRWLLVAQVITPEQEHDREN